jgi:hypothetical protein
VSPLPPDRFPLLRRVVPVVLGLFVAFAFIVGTGALGKLLYPPPQDLDPRDPVALRAFMSRVPTGMLLLVLAGWAAGAVAGTFVASRLGTVPRGWAVGALLLALGISNLTALPHPVWFWAATLTVFPLAALAGTRLAARRPPATVS